MRDSLYSYISGISKSQNCQILKIGGIEDHIHILAKLTPSISPSDFTRDIKSNSSKWIHEHYPNMNDFTWQAGFSCFSVSESAKDSVRKYIDSQEEHHKRLSFDNELKLFLEKHEVDFDPQHFLD